MRQPAPARDVRGSGRGRARRRPALDPPPRAPGPAAGREDGHPLGLHGARADLPLLQLRAAGLPERTLGLPRAQAAPVRVARADARGALEARPTGRAALQAPRRVGAEARRESHARRAALAPYGARALP